MMKNSTLQILIPFIFFISGCTEEPKELDVTIDTPQIGMIQGTVLAPSVENNLIIWNGLEGAAVTVINTEYSTTTTYDGM
ncbi:MAG: hypothetical protein K8S00_12960, partial [Bacteroidales bacterium]|nr:hypothetical protein [Bacteroidales bacterium]